MSRHPGSHGKQPRKLLASVVVPQAPVQVPSQVHYLLVLRQSHLLAKDKNNNKMPPVAVHRFPDICHKAEENPSLETVDETCTTSQRLKWGSLPPN